MSRSFGPRFLLPSREPSGQRTGYPLADGAGDEDRRSAANQNQSYSALDVKGLGPRAFVIEHRQDRGEALDRGPRVWVQDDLYVIDALAGEAVECLGERLGVAGQGSRRGISIRASLWGIDLNRDRARQRRGIAAGLRQAASTASRNGEIAAGVLSAQASQAFHMSAYSAVSRSRRGRLSRAPIISGGPAGVAHVAAAHTRERRSALPGSRRIQFVRAAG